MGGGKQSINVTVALNTKVAINLGLLAADGTSEQDPDIDTTADNFCKWTIPVAKQRIFATKLIGDSDNKVKDNESFTFLVNALQAKPNDK